jgi:succinate dehydrogenase / fumarate reductase cytochrome b subunit
LCNGIRHLFWDAGKGFDLATVNRSGIMAVLGAGALTLIAWFWGYSSMGAL